MSSPQQFPTEIWPIDRIRPYEKNARKIPQVAIDKVALSLKEFGWQQPIVVEENGLIVVGHVRRLAALKNGWTEAPVWIARGLTPAQIRAYRLMDNRSHEDAKWDMGILTLEMQELKLEGLDLELTGFSGAERDRALLTGNEQENDVPAVPVVPTARPADVWLCGPHRIICGDCTHPDVVKRVLNGEAPLLMVTDPPYGIELDNEWRDRAGLNGAGQPGKHRTAGHTQTSISGDTIADWSHAFELVPSLQVAYVWHASVFTREVLNGLQRLGFLYPQQIIWNKGRTVLTRTHYWYQHEPCWYVRKKNAPWFGKPGENATIWDAVSPKVKGSGEDKLDHPTQKPVELMRKSILNHTVQGDIVYEPFHGSGTTMAAAETTGRRCFGCELDPRYIDVVVMRWQNLAGEKATLEGDGRTFAQIAEDRKASSAPTPEASNA